MSPSQIAAEARKYKESFNNENSAYAIIACVCGNFIKDKNKLHVAFVTQLNTFTGQFTSEVDSITKGKANGFKEKVLEFFNSRPQAVAWQRYTAYKDKFNKEVRLFFK